MTAKFIATLQKFDSPLWSSHVQVPISIANQFLKANVKRVVCLLNGVYEYQCAIMPNGHDYYFLLVNQATVKKLKLSFGQVIEVVITKDASEYGMPMPEEFLTLLEQDIIFEKHFKNLTPGKQRNLLYLVGKPKSSEIKIRKTIVIAEHLNANQGKLDFKMLNEALKLK